MATLIISTNWASSEGIENVLEALSKQVAELTSIEEDELLVEMRVGVPICFGGRSNEYAAHCLWAFGGYGDNKQNRDLHEAVCKVLTRYLGIAPERVRITRVQLYEVLDHSTKTKTATSVVVSSASPASPPGARKGFLNTLSPRDKKKDEKKPTWSKSLERKRANELTAQKQKKNSIPEIHAPVPQSGLSDSTSSILRALGGEESDSGADSSDVSTTSLTAGLNN